MVNITKIHELYNAMMDVEEIATKDIKNMGITQVDITELVNTGVITRVRRGYYKISDLNKLFNYGKLLISLKRRNEAINCFKKCFQLDPNYIDAVHQLFINSIVVHEYEDTINYFDILYKSEPNNKRYLFYLYLLSYIIELPEQYKDKVIDITYENLKYEDDVNNADSLNNIISLVLNGKISHANGLKNSIVTFEDYADKVMLKESTACYTNYKKVLEELIKNEKYNEAIEALKNEKCIRNIPIYNEYLLYLMEDILKIKETGQVKEVVRTEYTVNMFNAINNNNYELALELCSRHNEKIGVNNEDNVMYLLLSRIVDLKKEYVVEEDVVEEPLVQDKENVSNVYFSDVVSSLLLNDLDKFDELLRSYLMNQNLVNNYDFINLLVQLCKLEQTDYSRVLVTMTQMINGSYVFDETYYIRTFYECVSVNDINKARIYLNLLDCSNHVLDELIMELHRVLDVLELSYEEVKNSTNVEVNLEDSAIEDAISPTIVERKVIPKKVNHYYDETDKQFILDKLDILNQTRGIMILRPMDNIRRRNIHNIVYDIRGLNSFSIGSGDNRRIVLRHNGCKYIDIKESIKEADNLFYAKKYNDAISIYLDILGTNNPKTFVYAKLGLAYLKINDIENTIMYLTVATELAKETKEDFDFSDLIASIDGSISKYEMKPRFKMKEEEFIDDLSDNFGVEKFDEMCAYVSELGCSIEEACNSLEFTLEEYHLSLLLIARNYYRDGNYNTGDNYLKQVEKATGKTKKVISKMDEIRRNKKFYIHRMNAGIQLTKSSK